MTPPPTDADAPLAVADLVRRAEAAGASDIHLQTAADHSAQVSFRLDGLLAPVETLPAGLAERVFGRIERAELGSQIEVRVATYPTVTGEKIVLRLFTQTTPPALREYALPTHRDGNREIDLAGEWRH